MPTKKKDAGKDEVSEILQITQGTFECCVVGVSPLIMNRMTEKVARGLLMPPPKKTAMQKATTLKHQPLQEYRNSVYRLRDPAAGALLCVRATALKGAIRSVAVDMPNARKAQVGRLTYIAGDYVPVYGVPQVSMMVVRSADMNRTPDIRTRAILPRWACRVAITYVSPLIRPQAVANLLAASGVIIGIGDGRPEKGAMSFGRYRVTDAQDPEFLDIVASGGREAQLEALETPGYYDDESQDLMEWFNEEIGRRKLGGIAQEAEPVHDTH